jgi:hypothetical protein
LQTIRPQGPDTRRPALVFCRRRVCLARRSSYNLVEAKNRQTCWNHIRTKGKEIVRQIELTDPPISAPRSIEFCTKLQRFAVDMCALGPAVPGDHAQDMLRHPQRRRIGVSRRSAIAFANRTPSGERRHQVPGDPADPARRRRQGGSLLWQILNRVDRSQIRIGIRPFGEFLAAAYAARGQPLNCYFPSSAFRRSVPLQPSPSKQMQKIAPDLCATDSSADASRPMSICGARSRLSGC